MGQRFMSIYLPGYVFEDDLEVFLNLNSDKFGLTSEQAKKFADISGMEFTVDLANLSERDLQHVATRTVLPHGIRHVIGMLRQAQTQRIGPYASANTQLRTLLFQLVNL
jgi:hypothetical protein